MSTTDRTMISILVTCLASGFVGAAAWWWADFVWGDRSLNAALFWTVSALSCILCAGALWVCTWVKRKGKEE